MSVAYYSSNPEYQKIPPESDLNNVLIVNDNEGIFGIYELRGKHEVGVGKQTLLRTNSPIEIDKKEYKIALHILDIERREAAEHAISVTVLGDTGRGKAKILGFADAVIHASNPYVKEKKIVREAILDGFFGHFAEWGYVGISPMLFRHPYADFRESTRHNPYKNAYETIKTDGDKMQYIRTVAIGTLFQLLQMAGTHTVAVPFYRHQESSRRLRLPWEKQLFAQFLGKNSEEALADFDFNHLIINFT
jgi:hypothetical protein